MSKRVLCILGSQHFYGKERSNIEVYNLLQDYGDCNLKVVVSAKASEDLKKYLKTFETVPVDFPDRSISRFKYVRYILTGIRLNLKLLFILLKFRPHYIFLNDERNFYDMGLPIYFSGSKVVYRIGDAPAFPKLSNYKVNAWIWKNIVLKKTETFVYISNFIKNTVKVTGRDTTGDRVIYNYPPRRKESNDSAISRYSDTNKLVIGYLGQIIPDKGVHLFVEAAVKLLNQKKEVLFYIAGDLGYDKKHSDILVQTVNKNGLENQIIFLGNIDDVNTFFKNIDVLVTPSIKEEPLGNVIVEAKKYATPSIIFNSGGMPELIGHGINGFICESRTSDDIAKGINYYLTHRELVDEHGSNASSSIEELKIDYASFKSRWLSIFEK